MKGASMIPAARSVADSNDSNSRGNFCLVLLLSCALQGCLAEPETSVSRMAREREVGAARARNEEQQQELARLRQQGSETVRAISAAKAESVRRAAELRAVLAQLDHQVLRLRTAEQDLDKAQVRAAEIERQLEPLRALERSLQDHEQRRAEAAQRVAALQAEIDELTRSAEQEQAKLLPRLQALKQQLAAAREIEAAIAGAQEAVNKALGALAPPAAVPAAAPAEQPPK